jgi:hemolysin activation/secretion protein
MNMNPFRSVQPVFAPGGVAGETDVVLRVQDRFPVRVYTGYENSGNELTGEDRWLFGLNWGNAFGLDHQLNYQYTTSDDFSTVQAHTVSYFAPLPWRHTLQVYAGYTESEVGVAPFDLEGSSTQAGVRYTIPLPTISNYTHEVFTGFDWKQSDNSLIFGIIPVTDTTTEIGQFVFGYRGGMPDRFGSTSGEISLIASPGGIFSNQTEADYNAVRPGAEDAYQYGIVRLDRLTRLPFAFTLANEFTYQWSDENLLPSEQMSFGGYNSIRGYEERELNNTDEGWILRTELRTPAISPLKMMGVQVDDELQLLGFWDYGYASASSGDVIRSDGTTADNVRMSSAGPGLRYRLNTWLSARIDYGFQLSDNANSPTNGRWHIGIVASY